MVHRSGKRAAVGVAAVLLLWPLAASTAFASTGPASGSGTAAAVQTVLDRVVGPGGATVIVSDTIQTSTTTSTSTRWGSGAVASSGVVTSGGATSTTQQNLVGSTTTDVSTPAGSLVRQSVAVAVDRSKLGSTSVATLRTLVTGAAGAAGVVASRGDRVSITVVTFAHPAAAVTPAASPITLLMPFAVPALWALGALAALVILVRAVGGPKRRRLPAGP